MAFDGGFPAPPHLPHVHGLLEGLLVMVGDRVRSVLLGHRAFRPEHAAIYRQVTADHTPVGDARQTVRRCLPSTGSSIGLIQIVRKWETGNSN